jgi:dienelactone hydrolase
MNLERVADLLAPDGHSIPAYIFSPDNSSRGGVVVCPSYGATKEHVLALSAAIAEKGLSALSIDPCGHGQNMTPIGPQMLDELDAAVHYMRRFGPVGATGISLGGRLALMSSADVMVAISPAVVATISPQGKWMFENFPSPSVREPYSGYVLELLDALGPVPHHDRPCLLLYAERDLPSLLEGAAGLNAGLPRSELRYITSDLRPDVQHEHALIRYLPRWFNHSELKFNLEMLNTVSTWFAEHLR